MIGRTLRKGVAWKDGDAVTVRPSSLGGGCWEVIIRRRTQNGTVRERTIYTPVVEVVREGGEIVEVSY